ncbi:MAG: LysM peptidoglycan-binding domain-containing protein [Deltaproteobacteria bacterium]|nr:LysM peptidoglycan-binding domain-containing protein [Deltaproteobacteria bacterium]
MKKGLIVFLGLMILLFGLGRAGEAPTAQKALDKEMDYIVKKGDTLWDISQRFYGDPFLWPRLWQQNQYITNPHWIYPGDRIRLYPYKVLIEEGKPPKVEVAKPVLPPKVEEVPAALPPPPVRIKLFSYPEVYSAGFITEEMEGIGSIVGAREDIVMLSEGDEVHLTFQKGMLVKKGDKFTIFRVGDLIRHPITHKVIGRKVMILGIVKVTEPEGETKMGLITLSFDPILRGDELLPYLPPREELAINKLERPLYGWIAASKRKKDDLGEGNIVYIDRGEGDEIKPGHLFQVFRRGQWAIDPISKKKVKLPDDIIGRLIVITTQKKTSTALITKSRLPIHVGDEVIGVTD